MLKKIGVKLDGTGKRIGIVQSRFNQGVSDGLLTGCLDALRKAYVREEDITILTVPGALELPLALNFLANQKKFSALVALGVVLRGETYHFDLVANESSAGLMRVMLDCQIPIGNGILTCDTEAQALVRTRDKGRDAAHAALELSLLSELCGAL